MADEPAPIWKDEWQAADFGPYKKFPEPSDRLRDFFLMQKYDSVSGAVLALTELKLLSRVGEYANEDERIQEEVRGQLERLPGWSRQVLRGLLTAIWAGFSISQLLWLTTAQRWQLVGVNTLHPMTFTSPYGQKQAIEIDQVTGQPKLFRQWGKHFQEHTLQPDEVVYWPLFKRFREDVYGQSMLERARKPWYVKTAIERFWNIWLEKGAYPTPIIQVPPGNVLDEVSGQTVTKATYYAKVFEKLTPGQAIVLEGGEQEKLLAEMFEGSRDLSGAYELACQYQNNQIFLSLLYPRMLVEEPEHGSRAQAGAMAQDFLLVLAGIAEELGEVLVQQLVKPIIVYNFGEQENYGEWQWQPFSTPDLLELSEIFQRLTSQFLMPVTVADQDKLRQVFGDLFVSAEEAGTSEARPPSPTQEEMALRYGWLG